ncbi:MAG: BON domain-containing protein, partial [Acidobacteriia bacterium]|nr:BON domain-containing protein [Terriglobia bacterium]
MPRLKARLAILTVLASMLLLGSCNILETFQPPDDKAIVSEVQAKLFEDPVLKTRDIRVTAEKGVVMLAGTVATELEKAAVERFASRAKGAKQVVNQLAVVPTTATAAPETSAPVATTAPAP